MKTSGALIVKNTIYNILGKAVPFIIALVSIPILIHHLGTDRFGILTITWVFVGYFSLFDLGLGRAVIKTVAERLGTDNEGDIIYIFRLTSLILGLLGLLAGGLLFLITPFLVHSLLNIPIEYTDESIAAFYYLSLAIPFTILSTIFRGILEAWQKFGLLNIVQSTIGILTYIIPVIIVLIEPRLDYVVASLAAIRIAGTGLFLIFAKKQTNIINKPAIKKEGLLRELIGFGGWVTVSNILDPLLNYFDRFVIGALLSMSAVAYFTTPYEVATKLVIIPAALVTSLFPAFSNLAVLAPKKLKIIIEDSYHFLIGGTFLISFAGIWGSENFLYYWVGEKFANESTLVLQIFLLGFFVNSIAKIPYSHLQSIGRPDVTAKIHLAELPFTIILIFIAVLNYGIIGVAFVRFFRLFTDMLLLMFFSFRCVDGIKMPFFIIMIHLSLLSLSVVGAFFLSNLYLISLILSIGGFLYILYFWKYASETRHRDFILTLKEKWAN
ncbi:MAG: flippase [Balneolaceae bacterium]